MNEYDTAAVALMKFIINELNAIISDIEKEYKPNSYTLDVSIIKLTEAKSALELARIVGDKEKKVKLHPLDFLADTEDQKDGS